jgi:hypothetical protein
MDFISFGVSFSYMTCLACLFFSSSLIKKEYNSLDWEICERINKISRKISFKTLFLIFFILSIMIAEWRDSSLALVIPFKIFMALTLISESMQYRKKMIQVQVPSGYINYVIKLQALMILCFAALQAFQAFLRVRSN